MKAWRAPSSLVTAVDFGPFNALPANLPYRFREALESIGFPDRNPGACWVSEFCYEARELLERCAELDAVDRGGAGVRVERVAIRRGHGDRHEVSRLRGLQAGRRGD